MMDSGGEKHCRCVPLHAVVCSRLTCAHKPVHVGPWWHPPSGFQFYRQTSERNLSPRRVCAHCTYCEQCTCNMFLLCTLAYVGNLLLSRLLSLSVTLSLLSLAYSPARLGGCRRLVQMHARTVPFASNALAAGICPRMESSHCGRTRVW